MTLTPRLRKFVLTVHVISAVGWLGAVAAFLALAVVGVTSQDAQMVRGVYLAMGVTTQFVIVPFCLASLVTGLVSSVGTEWGLFRHYWVLIKLLITIVSTFGLLIHLQPIRYLASVAAKTMLSADDFHVQIQLVIVSSAALLALLTATVLSMYKPKGITAYGWRKQNEKRAGVKL